MASSSFALFNGIPALYSSLPPRQRQRRTATNIMAGCFDPLPALASDSCRDDSSSSHGSIVTITEEEDAPERILTGAPRGKNTGWKALKAQKGLAIKRASESVSGKGKQVRRVVHEEKENALSDSDSGTSLSPFPASAAQRSLPSTDVPKASGFWRARSSNTPEGSSSALKRKLSSLFDDDSPSPPPASSIPAKKSRLAASIYSDILSSESLTSLSESPDEGPAKTYAEKLVEAVKPHISYGEVSSLMKDSSTVQCKICTLKIHTGPSSLQAHFSSSHPGIIANLGEPPLSDTRPQTSRSAPAPTSKFPERRQRGPRKNVAIKKGWKGWVEEDLEPQKLILLDKPEVLPERTTRSGRKID